MKNTAAPPIPLSRRRKCASWLALGALLFNLLAGVTLSTSSATAGALLAAADDGAFDTLVVCTPNGLRVIKLDADGTVRPEQTAGAKICAYCLPLTAGHGCIVSAQPVVSVPVRFVLHVAYADGDRETVSVALGISPPSRAPPFFA